MVSWSTSATRRPTRTVTSGVLSFARLPNKIIAVDNCRSGNKYLRALSGIVFGATPTWQDGRREVVEASSMVDDVFRSYRNQNTLAREWRETSRGGIGDLLAELTLLTGQGDLYRDGGRNRGTFQA